MVLACRFMSHPGRRHFLIGSHQLDNLSRPHRLLRRIRHLLNANAILLGDGPRRLVQNRIRKGLQFHAKGFVESLGKRMLVFGGLNACSCTDNRRGFVDVADLDAALAAKYFEPLIVPIRSGPTHKQGDDRAYIAKE
jgi:hypothetical protein